MCRHLVIPDTQVRKGVPIDHIKALGKYITDKQPEKIIILGDWWDFPSVSSWNSHYDQEGLRLIDDIGSGNEAMVELWKPLEAYNKRRKNKYKPKTWFLYGNHEDRLDRYISSHPELRGILGKKSLKMPKWIKRIPFKQIFVQDGLYYSHFFYNSKTGRPLGGTAQSKLNKLKFSFVQGHVQVLDIAREDLNNGSVLRGLVAGAFYMHDEPYIGPQGDHWRGCVLLHDVKNGDYAINEVQMQWLLDKYK